MEAIKLIILFLLIKSYRMVWEGKRQEHACINQLESSEYLSILSLSLYLSISCLSLPSVCLSICISVCLSVYLSFCFFVCLFHLSLFLSLSLSACLSLSLSNSLFIFFCVSLPSVCLPLSIYLSCLSVSYFNPSLLHRTHRHTCDASVIGLLQIMDYENPPPPCLAHNCRMQMLPYFTMNTCFFPPPSSPFVGEIVQGNSAGMIYVILMNYKHNRFIICACLCVREKEQLNERHWWEKKKIKER